MIRTSTTAHKVTLALLAIAATLALSGCALLAGWNETQSVSDANNLFHFKVPSKWLVSSEKGLVTVYAGGKLPAEGQKQEALAVLVMSSRTASETAVPEMIDYLVDARAKSRGWTKVTKSKATKASMGGRQGWAMDVNATNAQGDQFDGRYFFVRTGDTEAFVAAIAPPGKPIDSYTGDLDRITEQWYWHGSEQGSSESTDTTRK